MTDLPKRLEAAGRIKAEDYFKAKMPHLWKEYGLDLDRSHTMKAYVDSHRSLHPLIQKMAEALEKIKAENKPLECETEGPGDMHYWYQQELKSRDIAHEALAELEKYLGGV